MSVSRLADAECGLIDDVVDLDRYPIDVEGDRSITPFPRADLVDAVRSELADTGVARLPGFMRPRAVDAVRKELKRLRRHVWIQEGERSAYARDLSDVAQDDPRRRTSRWIAGHVTRDMIPPHSPAHRIYVSPMFKRFIAECVSLTPIFEYADPLAGLIATVLPPGGRYGWHYDTNEFVVTLAIASASSGGEFEYLPNLRRPGDENLEGLRAVYDGDRSGISTVRSEPGDLQLFLGRYSLHRVTEVGGDSDRLTLVLSYADRPGVIGPADRTRQVYGRVTEAHLIADAVRLGTDGLIL